MNKILLNYTLLGIINGLLSFVIAYGILSVFYVTSIEITLSFGASYLFTTSIATAIFGWMVSNDKEETRAAIISAFIHLVLLNAATNIIQPSKLMIMGCYLALIIASVWYIVAPRLASWTDLKTHLRL